MRPDGSDVRKLTDSVGFSGDPAYSPDGSLIAFDRDAFSGVGVYVDVARRFRNAPGHDSASGQHGHRAALLTRRQEAAVHPLPPRRELPALPTGRHAKPPPSSRSTWMAPTNSASRPGVRRPARRTGRPTASGSCSRLPAAAPQGASTACAPTAAASPPSSMDTASRASATRTRSSSTATTTLSGRRTAPSLIAGHEFWTDEGTYERGLVVVDADGSNLHWLSTEFHDDHQPDWGTALLE